MNPNAAPADPGGRTVRPIDQWIWNPVEGRQ
jgi:hypothetical protein